MWMNNKALGIKIPLPVNHFQAYTHRIRNRGTIICTITHNTRTILVTSPVNLAHKSGNESLSASWKICSHVENTDAVLSLRYYSTESMLKRKMISFKHSLQLEPRSSLESAACLLKDWGKNDHTMTFHRLCALLNGTVYHSARHYESGLSYTNEAYFRTITIYFTQAGQGVRLGNLPLRTGNIGHVSNTIRSSKTSRVRQFKGVVMTFWSILFRTISPGRVQSKVCNL